jgi:hypothetical protein
MGHQKQCQALVNTEKTTIKPRGKLEEAMPMRRNSAMRAHQACKYQYQQHAGRGQMAMQGLCRIE